MSALYVRVPLNSFSSPQETASAPACPVLIHPNFFCSDIADLGAHTDRGPDLVPTLADYPACFVPYLFLAEGHYERKEEEDEAEHYSGVFGQCPGHVAC